MPVAEATHTAHGATCDHDAKPLWLRIVTVDAVALRRVILGLFSLALILPAVPGYPGITCPLRALTGVPCPFCGTTGAVGEAARLSFVESLRTNPGPLIAVVVALFLFALRPARLRVPLLILIGLPTGMWVVQLFRFS
jgi:hypothetical protein